MLQALVQAHKSSREHVLANGGVELVVQALVSFPASSKLVQHASMLLERLGLPAHPADERATQRAAKALEQARARWPK
eukprot:COSAG02_NODE_1289_length_13445_cov_16.898322_4_plen_78_part_00